MILTKRVKQVMVAVVLLLLAGTGLWYWTDITASRRFQTEKTNLKRDLDLKLPLGSQEPVITRFLDDHRIAFSEFEPQWKNESDMVRLMWTHDPWYKDATKAIRGNAEWIRSATRECRLEIELKIDKDERLLGHREHTICRDSLF